MLRTLALLVAIATLIGVLLDVASLAGFHVAGPLEGSLWTLYHIVLFLFFYVFWQEQSRGKGSTSSTQ